MEDDHNSDGENETQEDEDRKYEEYIREMKRLDDQESEMDELVTDFTKFFPSNNNDISLNHQTITEDVLLLKQEAEMSDDPAVRCKIFL